MKKIKVQNLYLPIITEILESYVLDDRKSAIRRRFLRVIKPFSDDYKENTKELAQKYAKKNDKDEFNVVDNQYQFTPENKKIVVKLIKEIDVEVISIDILPSNEIDLKTISTVFKDNIKKFIEEKKNSFTAMDYDYVATTEEILSMLIPVESKK